MFIFFKTTVDFNVLRSPGGKRIVYNTMYIKSYMFKHLIGDEYGNRICLFGKVAIFPLIFVLLSRHYMKIPQYIINLGLTIAFVLSLLNLNAVVYLVPIFLIEYLNI
jgi:hypothetical protein